MVDILRRFEGFSGQAPDVETVEYMNDSGLIIPYNLLPEDNSVIAQQLRQLLATTSVVKESSDKYVDPVISKATSSTTQTNEEKVYDGLVAAGNTTLTQSDIDADLQGATAYLQELRAAAFKAANSL